MKFLTMCPECGAPPIATLETIHGSARLTEPNADGEQDYAGKTDIDWDAQESQTDGNGAVEVFCRARHYWCSKVQS